MNRGSCACFAFRSASADRPAFFMTLRLGRGHFGKILYLERVAVEGADFCAELGDDRLGKDGRSIEENGGGSGRRMKALSESIRGDVLHQEAETRDEGQEEAAFGEEEAQRLENRVVEEERGEERRGEERRGEERRAQHTRIGGGTGGGVRAKSKHQN